MKAAQAVRGRLSQKSGNILVYIVMLMVIFAMLGVAMVSLFSTSIGSSATANDTRRATYLSEAGIRYAASELRAAHFSKTAITNLNNTVYTVSAAGRFDLNIFSPWFEPASGYPTCTQLVNVDVPEGELPPGFLNSLPAGDPALLLVIPDYISSTTPPKPGPDAQSPILAFSPVTLTSLRIQLADDFCPTAKRPVAMAVTPFVGGQIIPSQGFLDLKLAAKNIFPQTGGAFEVQTLCYYYRWVDPAFTDRVRLTGVTRILLPGQSTTEINVAADDPVILSPRTHLIVSEGRSGQVTFGNNIDHAAAIVDHLSPNPISRKPDIEFDEEAKLSDVMSKTESDSGFAGVDDAGRKVTFRRTSGTPFASVLFKDTRAIGGQRQHCVNGACVFGDGVRAFFVMTFSGPGDGFTFSLLNAGNNTTTSVGGDFDMGELMGYAGDGRTGTDPATYIGGTEHGLEPPKMAVEFDGFYNNSPAAYCADATTVNHSTRFDPEVLGGGRDAVQYVFWGSRNPLLAPCRDNSPLYDDNRHNPQDTASKQWDFSGVAANEAAQAIKTSPVDGTIYVIFGDNSSNSDSRLLALDPISGSLKWQFAPPLFGGDDDLNAIAVDNAGNIYVGSDSSRLFARKADGSQLWAPLLAGGQVESPMAISESPARIYFGANAASNGILFAVNKGNGSPIWFFDKSPDLGEIPGGVTLDQVADPVDGQGTLYFGSDINPFLYAVRTSGTARWRYPSSTQLSGDILTQPVVNPTNRDVIFASTNGRVYALPYSTSSTPTARWTFNTGSSVQSALAISPDGNTVYVGTIGGVLFALKSSDGTELWRYPSSGNVGAIKGKPAVDGDGTVYFGSGNGHVFALNPGAGPLTDAQRVRWVYPSSGSIGAIDIAIEIGKDGNILFISNDGKLYSVTPFTIPANLRNLYLTDNEVQAPGVSGPDWFGQATWAVRVEVDRSQSPNANGKFEYTLRTWMRRCTDASACSDIVGTLYGDTRLRYDPQPSPVTALPMIQTIELSGSAPNPDHTLFDRFLFGFTSGSGSDQTITLSKFQLSFIRPNDPVVTTDSWP